MLAQNTKAQAIKLNRFRKSNDSNEESNIEFYNNDCMFYKLQKKNKKDNRSTFNKEKTERY